MRLAKAARGLPRNICADPFLLGGENCHARREVKQSRAVPALMRRRSDAALKRLAFSLDNAQSLGDRHDGRLEGPIIAVVSSPHQGEQGRCCTIRAETLDHLAPTTGETPRPDPGWRREQFLLILAFNLHSDSWGFCGTDPQIWLRVNCGRFIKIISCLGALSTDLIWLRLLNF